MSLPTAIYVWLVPSEHVQEQPGSWRIRKWDTEPFPEANFTLGSEIAPSKTDDELCARWNALWLTANEEAQAAMFSQEKLPKDFAAAMQKDALRRTIIAFGRGK